VSSLFMFNASAMSIKTPIINFASNPHVHDSKAACGKVFYFATP
jgi:hypothetical protein